jgi:PPOX class probable F420-dependent enzyme
MADSDTWKGDARSLTAKELKAFLSKPWIARLATLDADTSPYLSTVWYEYEQPVFILAGRAKSQWVHNLIRDPRVAMHIADDDPPHTRVSLQGKAKVVAGPAGIEGKWVDIANRMARRYLGERGPEYLLPTLNRKRYWIKVRPEKLTTWTGIEWHPKYHEA